MSEKWVMLPYLSNSDNSYPYGLAILFVVQKIMMDILSSFARAFKDLKNSV
jgi:hypothetical protein